MSKFKRFGEFVEAKKGEEIKPEEGLAGKDYDGPLATKPPQEPTKGKKDRPLPYKAAGEVKAGVWVANDQDTKKPLADEGTPGITPQTSPLGEKPKTNVNKLPKPKKITSEEFIVKTKNMTNAELFNFMLEGKAHVELTPVNDLYGNEFTPDPTQSIQYVCGLILSNPTMMQRFVLEMKHRNGLEEMVSELMDHGDTYDHLVVAMEDPDHGVGRVGKLARTMNDKYMNMMDKFDLGESVSPSLDVTYGKSPNKPQGDKFGGGGPFGGEPTRNPNYKDRSPWSANTGKESNPMGAQSMHDISSSGGSGNVMGSPNAQPQFPGGQPLMPPGKKMMSDGSNKHSLRESAATHMINELSNYPDFKSHMKKRCIGDDCPDVRDQRHDHH